MPASPTRRVLNRSKWSPRNRQPDQPVPRNSRFYNFGTFAPSDILSEEILIDHVFTIACVIPNYFGQCQASVGTPPAATWTADIQHNGVSIGSLTIDTNGEAVFDINDVSVDFQIEDTLTLIAPTATDASIERLRVTFRGVY